MNYNVTANILYGMCLDMDYRDYSDHASVTISNIAASLQELDASGEHVELLECLEVIAGENTGLFDWFKGVNYDD